MITKASKQFFLILFMLIISTAGSQDVQKSLSAMRTPLAPKIDGKLNELQWLDAEPAKDFIQYDPYNAAKPSQPTVTGLRNP